MDDESFLSGLRVWNGGDIPDFIPILRGENVSWVFRGPRRCIGSIDESLISIRCPEDSIILQRGMQRCGPCSALDFVDPCIRCDGRNCMASTERRSQCDNTDYAVYLVVFNDETLKIGVSSEKSDWAVSKSAERVEESALTKLIDNSVFSIRF